jgi:hypothetical protein
VLQAQRTETGGPARVTDGVLFQDCGDGTGLACWTGSAFKAAVSSQVKDKVAELKDFLVRLCQTITANDKRIRAKKNQLRSSCPYRNPPQQRAMATVNEAEFDQSVSLLRESFEQYQGTHIHSP